MRTTFMVYRPDIRIGTGENSIVFDRWLTINEQPTDAIQILACHKYTATFFPAIRNATAARVTISTRRPWNPFTRYVVATPGNGFYSRWDRISYVGIAVPWGLRWLLDNIRTKARKPHGLLYITMKPI